MNAKDVYSAWLEDPYFDEETKKELRSIAGDEKEIEERFYTELEFGTAGLRGIIGAGTNRMNKYTVRKATQGLANYIILTGNKEKGVAVSYDSRHMSPEFADEAALCLAANGIRAYVFTSLRPTPELSFAVRYYGCTAGINITASHNPAEYNGYKVYWEDGAQITPPHDTGIMAEVKKISGYGSVRTMDKKEALQQGLYIPIDQEADEAYYEAVKNCILSPEEIKKYAKELKIVYTPLHGTGLVPVTHILADLGFEQVYVVESQREPDGAFPTVKAPNPETEEAFLPALELAKEVDADLILATDPDADRLGVRIRIDKGVYKDLNGNVSGCLIGEYQLARRKELGILPADGELVTSIVSTNMSKAIAESYGVKFVEVLTGFKYIGREMLRMEQEKDGTFLFGFEESYGCLFGTYARDKDAVAASMGLCETAAYARSKGLTLNDILEGIYSRVGYYSENVASLTMAGIEGLNHIAAIMENLRKNPPSRIGAYEVKRIRDYKSGKILDCGSGAETGTGLPSANVLYYDLENDGWVAVRPSGTEPKIKLYFGIRSASEADAGRETEEMKKNVAKLAEI
ncbi:MAG: phospho-sugar mutase [Lachnospiraceae bacterium]|nr:phospho-sugar mutase [Lachnospiraceae bacterium]